MHLKKRTFCVGRPWILWRRRLRLKTAKSLVCFCQGADGMLEATVSANGGLWEAASVQGTEVLPTAGEGKIRPWDPQKHETLETAGLQYVIICIIFLTYRAVGRKCAVWSPWTVTLSFFLLLVYLFLLSALILSSIPLLSRVLFYFVEMDSHSSGWPQTHQITQVGLEFLILLAFSLE